MYYGLGPWRGRCDIVDMDGRTALDRAYDDEVRELIAEGAGAFV